VPKINADINDRQQAVLVRIGDGRSPVTSADPDLAVTVYALRNRRLVSVDRQGGGSWVASLTDRGRYLLEHGRYPGQPAGANPPELPDRRAASQELTVGELVERVTANGGSLTIVDPDPSERRRWRRAIYFAVNSGGLPTGMRLRHAGRDRGDLVLRLVPDTPENQPRKTPEPSIPVRARLDHPHPAIAATSKALRRGSGGWTDTRQVDGLVHMHVTHPHARRVLLLAQSIADEAVRRGHLVSASRSQGCDGGFCVVVHGEPFELVFSEETDRVPHLATRAELADTERHSWVRIPRWDHIPSGRLELRSGHDQYGIYLAADRARWRLDDKLGHAFELLEAAAAEAEAARRERERRDAERVSRWEAAMAMAKVQLLQKSRVDALASQIQEWEQARRIRDFIEHTRATPSIEVDPAWLDWVRIYADQLDPTHHPVTFPPEPEPTPEALRPFLDQWSSYGPNAFR
jgi:hypothetical protein